MEYESKPDEAYLDRNLCVQVMARMARQLGYNAGIRENIDWPILYIDLPTGQVSWHVPKEDVVRKFPVHREIAYTRLPFPPLFSGRSSISFFPLRFSSTWLIQSPSWRAGL